MAKKTEKRIVENYEIEAAFYINGKEIVFGADESAELAYFVADCSRNNPFGIEEYKHCIGTANYAEAMQEFGQRIHDEAQKSMERIAERGDMRRLTINDCIPGSKNGDYENQLIVIRPDILQRDKQSADYQLCLAVGGFGCRADASGRAVFVRTVYDGRELRYELPDVLGVIKPERIPDWVKERISNIEQHKTCAERER